MDEVQVEELDRRTRGLDVEEQVWRYRHLREARDRLN